MRRAFLANIAAALLLLSGAGPALAAETAAEDPIAAEDFIQQLADDALAVLNNTAMTQRERDEAFRSLLKEGFALNYVSRLVLGRHGRTATPSQKREYEKVFPEYILRIYSNRLSEAGDEDFVVGGTGPAGKRDIYVRSKILRPDGPPLSADWRVRMINEELKVIDLKIEGISMVVTQRDEFMAKISSDGLDSLIADLKRQTDTGIDPAVSAPSE